VNSDKTKCACKLGCKERCSCTNNRLFCSPLLKYYGGNCEHILEDDNDRDDTDSEDED